MQFVKILPNFTNALYKLTNCICDKSSVFAKLLQVNFLTVWGIVIFLIEIVLIIGLFVTNFLVKILVSLKQKENSILQITIYKLQINKLVRTQQKQFVICKCAFVNLGQIFTNYKLQIYKSVACADTLIPATLRYPAYHSAPHFLTPTPPVHESVIVGIKPSPFWIPVMSLGGTYLH